MEWNVVKDEIISLEENKNNIFLYEDMYQLVFGNYVIDSGWYEQDISGHFITFLIKDEDWENPVIKIVTTTIKDVKWSIFICQEYLLAQELA